MNRQKPASAGLLERVSHEAVARGLFAGVRRLLVGCSGGADSVVLTHLLRRAAGEFGLELVVGHLDHGLRGEASDADALFVRELADQLGLPCALGRSEIADGESGRSEGHLRDRRLAFFREASNEHGCDAVALGHTMDDQAETVLLSLARGAGPAGLAGMRPRRRVGGLLVIRPLLRIPRSEVRAYARDRGLAWVEDASNRDLVYARNRVRQQVLPALEAAIPGSARAAARLADIMSAEEEWLEALVAAEFTELTRPEEHPGGVALDAAVLRGRPRALRARLVRAAIGQVRGSVRGISREHVEAVLVGVLESAAGSRDLPGVRVLLEGTRLRFRPLADRQLVWPQSGVGRPDAS